MSMSSKRKGEAPPFAALEAELERLAQRGGELTSERETAAAEYAAARAHLAMTLIGKGDVSAADTRSLSSFIEKVLTDHLRARGYLPKQQAAR
jgi:phage shock protein A